MIKDYGMPGVTQPDFKWNWGAFALTPLWGIGNRFYAALLSLIPVVGLIVSFLFGLNGSRWLWNMNKHDSTREFNYIQGTWNKAGFVAFWFELFFAFIIIGLIALGTSLFYFAMNHGSVMNF